MLELALCTADLNLCFLFDEMDDERENKNQEWIYVTVNRMSSVSNAQNKPHAIFTVIIWINTLIKMGIICDSYEILCIY